ncbi:MAG: DUF3795 domain-containing protein [Elusimicrobia bacterium]|nr:DUF3795 domain-containing protein [Elusimicrobiota bacterium]
MAKVSSTEKEIILIAPCGMNCGICSSYLAYSRNIPKKRGKVGHCIGCRPRNKKCVYIKCHCPLLSNNSIKFCFQCDHFPCERLKHLDERYRKNYGMSMIENLKIIKLDGMEKFIKNQNKKYMCLKCGAKISVHNKICYDCKK